MMKKKGKPLLKMETVLKKIRKKEIPSMKNKKLRILNYSEQIPTNWSFGGSVTYGSKHTICPRSKATFI